MKSEAVIQFTTPPEVNLYPRPRKIAERIREAAFQILAEYSAVNTVEYTYIEDGKIATEAVNA